MVLNLIELRKSAEPPAAIQIRQAAGNKIVKRQMLDIDASLPCLQALPTQGMPPYGLLKGTECNSSVLRSLWMRLVHASPPFEEMLTSHQDLWRLSEAAGAPAAAA